MGATPSYPCISCPIRCQSPRHRATATIGSSHCSYMKNPLEIRQHYSSGSAGSVLQNSDDISVLLHDVGSPQGSLRPGVLWSYIPEPFLPLPEACRMLLITSPLAAVIVCSLDKGVVLDSILQSSFPIVHVCTHPFRSLAGWQRLMLSSSPHFILGTVRGLTEIG